MDVTAILPRPTAAAAQTRSGLLKKLGRIFQAG